MKRTTILIAIALTMALGACNRKNADYLLPEPAPGFVTLQDGHFAIDGEPWFPLMLNYKAFIVGDSVAPAPWYTGSLRNNFDTIAAWGFNAVRVCLDVLDVNGDTVAMFAATRRMIQQADSAGLRVMLLIKPPFDALLRP